MGAYTPAGAIVGMVACPTGWTIELIGGQTCSVIGWATVQLTSGPCVDTALFPAYVANGRIVTAYGRNGYRLLEPLGAYSP